jgi:hypothetical protein
MRSKDFLSIYKQYSGPTEYAKVMNDLCKKYREKIIASHKKKNNLVYYEDPQYLGCIIKKMPDGTKFLIENTPNHRDKIIQKLE